MYLGIEIGGTKLQLGVGDGQSGQLAAQWRLAVERQHGAAGIRAQLEALVPEVLAAHPVQRIGIGFGGPVQEGRALKSHQIEGWDAFPLATWCQEKFGMEAHVSNDCDAAALAEALFGAGRHATTVFYVTVGTGVGGGLVIGRRLHGHGRPAVAEIGHLRPGLEATQPSLTVESVASGLGIELMARESLTKLPVEDPMVQAVMAACDQQPRQLTTRMLASLLDEGNSIALSAYESCTRMLGWAIAQVITITAADVIVVGGGVSLVGEKYFFEPLRRYVADYVFPPLRDSYRVVPAELGEWVVVHGALALAAEGSSGPK